MTATRRQQEVTARTSTTSSHHPHHDQQHQQQQQQPHHHPNAPHRRRYKQTLAQPRHLWSNDASVSEKLSKMVWVTVGKTEHAAWVVEENDGSNHKHINNSSSRRSESSVLIEWESTKFREYVPIWDVRYNMPGIRTRRLRSS